MKQKRSRGAVSLAGILLVPLVWVLLAAQAPVPPAAPPGSPPAPSRSPAVSLEGREIAVPVTMTPSGPLFGLEALVRHLGGELSPLEPGESFTLKLDDKEIIVGVGSAVITVGENIVSLGQPPVVGQGGLLVPLDFLSRTYGDLLGYAFEWRPEASRLAISRRGGRELRVMTDVVHQQGITTVVLQFPDVPRYRLEKQPGAVLVQVTGDRLAVPPVQTQVADPLVQNLEVSPQQIRVQLAPDAEVQSYVLENPFRIVLDVHQPAEVEVPTPTLRRPERQPGIRTIVLDPGHGGTESGAVGPGGALEKELTLTLARELEARLEQAGIRVVLTRNEDASLPHDTRTAIANQNKADLFISIHLNSSLGSGAHGAETYFLSTEATDLQAAQAAAAENPPAGAGAGGDPLEDLQLILWDLAQSHHMAESQRFANLVQGELNQAAGLRDRGVKQAPFRVLMGAAMPAVLVELGFLSNPEEEKKLQTAEYRGALLDALVRAVQRYKALVEKRPEPAGPAPAAPGTPAAPGGPGTP